MALQPKKGTTATKEKARSRDDDDERDMMDDDDRPARKKPARDDDEDDRPAKSRRREEEDDDPPAKSKASKRDADDDDDRPARKPAKKRDEDDDDAKGGGDDDVIDFSETDEDDGELELIKPGRYEAVIDETIYSESKEKGTPMITCRFELDGGDYSGRKLWYRLLFTPKMAGRLKRDLRILTGKKVDGQMNKKQFIKLADSGKLIGERALLQVISRTYEGEKRNDIRRLLDKSEETAEDGDGFFG